MKKFIFLLTLLCILSSNSLWSIELDTVWVSDISGQVLFQHPVTKNILVAANGGITELNSQDGKFVRSFTLNTENTLEMSPDGTKMLYYFWEDTKFIIELYDYNTQKVIFKTAGLMPKFLDNNNFVFLLPSDGKQVNLNKCKIENKEITKHPIYSNGPVTAFSASPNGKYIAYATFEEITDTESKAHLYLLDAETMQGLGELGSWDSEWKQIRSIRFSPDSKYLTYSPEYFYVNFPVQIFDLTNKNVLKTYTPFNFNYYNCTVTFLDRDLYIIRGRNLDKEESEVRIYNINNDKLLFKTNEFSKYVQTLVYESAKNYLYSNTPANKTFCFNLNNIISGVAPVVPIKIEYSNKTLYINSIDKPLKQISIMTIEGREVYHQSFERLMFNNNEIEIPLELSNGSYIINLVSDKETFTEKIIILD